MASKKAQKPKWVAHVMATSFALQLPEGIFTWPAKKIAVALKKSAEESTTRKGTPLQSAMSMLTFYINRAGKKMNAQDKARIEQAKIELRKLFN